MALVNTRKMFEMAYKNGYAIGAFNVNNMEITQHPVEESTVKCTTLIPHFSSGRRKYGSREYIRHLVDAAPETSVRILRLLEGPIVFVGK